MKKVLALVILLIVAGLAVIGTEVLRPYRGYAGQVIVDIPAGTQAPEVASRLVAQGVLAHQWPFLLIYATDRWRHHLKAGEYLFDHPMRPLDVYRKLIRGEVYLRCSAFFSRMFTNSAKETGDCSRGLSASYPECIPHQRS